jgi:glycosyltransferase involved in cell wall biosynthesis
VNICLLNLDYKPFRTAGLSVYGELLADGLHAAGHQVTVVAARRPGSQADETIEGVRVVRVPIGRADWVGFGWQSARRLTRLTRTERFDVIHFLDVRFAWAFHGDCIASLFESFWQRLHARGNMPYYHSLPNLAWRYTYFVLVNWTLQRWAVAHPQMLIAASQAARDEFIQHYSIPPERIVVVPLGIDTRRYQPQDSSALRKKLGLEGQRVILYVGFTTPRKGLEYLGQALQELGPDCRLLIVGKWEPGYREKFYRSLHPATRERILEVGYVPDDNLPYYYSLADVFVFPSLLEGFGLPVAEAMACGAPVIAANTSSLPEVIGDAGILVPAMDSAALADALRKVLGNEELRRTLAARGIQRARSIYSQSGMAARTLDVYGTYVARRRE